jgi:hypothetical protein
MSTKICARCKKDLPLTSFEERHPGKTRTICKPCRSSRMREVRSAGYVPYLRVLISNTKSHRKATHEFAITPELLVELWEKQDGRCAISGVILTHHTDGSGLKEFNASIDRIDSTQGYIPGNIQLVAYRANVLKQNLSTDMLYWWVKTIYHYSCD